MTPAPPPAGPPPGWRPAVLIMAKAPVPGTVKTRLYPLLGPDGCARLQQELIRHATATAVAAGQTVFLAVAPAEAASEVRALAPAGVQTLGQRGAGLGERLTGAVADVFAAGYRPVVVIGTDAPTLTPDLLARAFGSLADGRDVVFGPACDGGYYLAAMTRPVPELFALDPGLWGTGEVLTASLAAARRAGLLPGCCQSCATSILLQTLRRCWLTRRSRPRWSRHCIRKPSPFPLLTGTVGNPRERWFRSWCLR
jgi:uncharacterized protein